MILSCLWGVSWFYDICDYCMRNDRFVIMLFLCAFVCMHGDIGVNVYKTQKGNN
jgi:hypothetical protein